MVVAFSRRLVEIVDGGDDGGSRTNADVERAKQASNQASGVAAVRRRRGRRRGVVVAGLLGGARLSHSWGWRRRAGARLARARTPVSWMVDGWIKGRSVNRSGGRCRAWPGAMHAAQSVGGRAMGGGGGEGGRAASVTATAWRWTRQGQGEARGEKGGGGGERKRNAGRRLWSSKLLRWPALPLGRYLSLL